MDYTNTQSRKYTNTISKKSTVGKSALSFFSRLTFTAELLLTLAVIASIIIIVTGSVSWERITGKGTKKEEAARTAGRVIEEIKTGEKAIIPLAEEESIASLEINTSNWKEYKNKWYGFELKYPKNWDTVTTRRPVSGDKWELRYQFRKKDPDEKSVLSGFDVIIYAVEKVKGLENTEEIKPKKYSSDISDEELCIDLEGKLTEDPEFPAEEVYIPQYDNCHSPSFFYSLTRDNYIYNMVPAYIEEGAKAGDLKIQVSKYLPEFYTAASEFNLIDIVRPPPKPKITAPMPASAKKVGGKLVCAKKNDKPRKSKQGKGMHLDMECCLDPDEYPNPWCTY